MEHNKVNKMATTPIFKLLITMSLPAIFSMLVQSLYNIVDSIFVAQIGESALAAVSLAFPVQTMIIAIAVGTGIGINSLIARSLGEKNSDKAQKAANQGVWLALISWIVFAFIGAMGSKAFFQFFTTDEVVVQMGTEYLSIVTVLSVGVFMQITLEKIFQGTGNMMYSMIIQLAGAITNIILDPIFIFGWFGLPAMGVAGAGIATVIGQLVGMSLGFYLIIKKPKGVTLHIGRFKLDKEIVKEIYKVGFPSIIMQSIMAFVVVILNNILIAFSQTAVSVLGVYFKLQSFVFMPVFGLTQGAMPIMGYNYGARNKKRLMSCLKLCIISATVIMALGTVLFTMLPEQLIGMFNGSDELVQTGVVALRIISMSFIFAGISISISTFFQAIGDGVKSLIISIIRQVIILLPLAVILSNIWNEVGVWSAFVIAEVVAVILSIIFFIIRYRQHIKLIDEENRIESVENLSNEVKKM